MNWELILGVTTIVAAVVAVVYAGRAGGLKAANAQIDTLLADKAAQDRSEAALHQAFNQSQLDTFRKVFFPIFALGLAITPEGDLDQAIGRFQKLVDTVTDGLPNVTVTGTGAGINVKFPDAIARDGDGQFGAVG
jgi:hypothetical protein